jgi:ERCC4-related helicase
MDLPDIKVIVQWRAPASISTLWQRFGRCVRDPSLHGTVVLLAEREHFEHLRNTNKKRKSTSRIKTESGLKRARLTLLSDHASVSMVDEEHVYHEDEEDGDDEQD